MLCKKSLRIEPIKFLQKPCPGIYKTIASSRQTIRGMLLHSHQVMLRLNHYKHQSPENSRVRYIMDSTAGTIRRSHNWQRTRKRGQRGTCTWTWSQIRKIMCLSVCNLSLIEKKKCLILK